GVSLELCGGTHVAHTGEIGLFRIVGETGVAAGVRRIEAVSGSEAYGRAVATEELLNEAAAQVRTTPDNLVRRLEQLTEENRELRRQLERARQAGAADVVGDLLGAAADVDGVRVVATEVDVDTPDELRALGDRLRERLGSGAAVVAGRSGGSGGSGGSVSLLAVVTDDLVSRGVRADALVREVAKVTGGSGGGRPHMAQGGVGDPAAVAEALERTAELVRGMLEAK
ncbi:MAG: DHHA1 domain-containing protein, partial [Gemmatimonadota bacterium]